jgi:hypothetical protein
VVVSQHSLRPAQRTDRLEGPSYQRLSAPDHSRLHRYKLVVLYLHCYYTLGTPTAMQGLLPHSPGLLPVQKRTQVNFAVHSRTYRCSPLKMQPWLGPAPCQAPSARCQHIAQANKPSEHDQLQAETSSSLQQADSSTDSSQGGVKRLLVLGGLVAVAASILYGAGGLSGLKDQVHDLEDLIEASGYLGPLIYAGAYTASTVLLFPASVLTLAAGYLFGELMLMGCCFFNTQSWHACMTYACIEYQAVFTCSCRARPRVYLPGWRTVVACALLADLCRPGSEGYVDGGAATSRGGEGSAGKLCPPGGDTVDDSCESREEAQEGTSTWG